MTHEIFLRPAVHDDALCLGVLATQVFLHTYAPWGIDAAVAHHVHAEASTQAYADLLADPGMAIVVAECNAHLVGFAVVAFDCAHELLPPTPAAELRRLYVQEPFTGRGVGRRLLQQAEVVAAQRGAGSLWLTAWHGNARALAFYPRQDYAVGGETVFNFEGQDVPNRLFVKELTR